MLNYLVGLCTTEPGQLRLIVFSDLFIAIAYFSIPFSMLWVFRNRKEDLPYPGLWISFVLFIFACGLTHFLHVARYFLEMPLTGYTAALHFATALVSIATAVSLTLVLPKVNLLPSPRRQRLELEKAVEIASREKDAMLVELNHRVGNQLAKLSALTRKELRETSGGNNSASLDRIRLLLEEMSAEHHRLQRDGYSGHHPAHHFLGRTGASR